MRYLSARLALDSLVVTGAPHSPAVVVGAIVLSSRTVFSLPVVGARVVVGAWVVVGEGRHWGGSGCHRPPWPQVICWGPSILKPCLHVKLMDSPTRYSAGSVALLTELDTAGAEQVDSPTEEKQKVCQWGRQGYWLIWDTFQKINKVPD